MARRVAVLLHREGVWALAHARASSTGRARGPGEV
jgi:hypothetical protein